MADLFDHVPDLVFFVKDRAGRYRAVNQTLADRCGARERRALIGRHVSDVFPPALAARYAAQDESVLRTGRAILDRLELHWYARGREGWCLTTKLPVRDSRGNVVGLIGISRDLRAPGDRDAIPPGLVGAMEHLEASYDGTITPPILAQKAGLSSRKL
jgi:PAS domain S-box-containing protein